MTSLRTSSRMFNNLFCIDRTPLYSSFFVRTNDCTTSVVLASPKITKCVQAGGTISSLHKFPVCQEEFCREGDYF